MPGYPSGAPAYPGGSLGMPGYPAGSNSSPGMTGYPQNSVPGNPMHQTGMPGYPPNPGPGMSGSVPPGTPAGLAYPLSPTGTTNSGQPPLYPALPNSTGNSSPAGGWNVRPGF